MPAFRCNKNFANRWSWRRDRACQRCPSPLAEPSLPSIFSKAYHGVRSDILSNPATSTDLRSRGDTFCNTDDVEPKGLRKIEAARASVSSPGEVSLRRAVGGCRRAASNDGHASPGSPERTERPRDLHLEANNRGARREAPPLESPGGRLIKL